MAQISFMLEWGPALIPFCLPDPADTNIVNQQTYTEIILKYARSSTSLAQTVYLFEAYDESWKPGANVIKLFTGVSYDFSKWARVFVPGKPFQRIQMFVGETRSLP